MSEQSSIKCAELPDEELEAVTAGMLTISTGQTETQSASQTQQTLSEMMMAVIRGL